MNIAIVTSGHPPFDERIFHKIGLSLRKYNNEVSIICSTGNIDTISEGINFRGFDGYILNKKEKIKKLTAKIEQFRPSLIICCEPLTILAAYRYKKENSDVKIISDITEYYPLRSTLKKYSGLNRILNYLRHFFFNIYVTNLADYLFIGEKRKVRLYYFIAPTKKKAIIGYYPPSRLFRYSRPPYDGKNFTLCYAGNISEPRGFRRYLTLIKKAADLFPDKTFTALIIGEYESEVLRRLTGKLLLLKNVKVDYHDKVDYVNYSDALSGADVCIDLRDKNSVFNRSLPIKVFDYMACGKPVIYSNLKPFKEFKDVEEFGLLIEPDDINGALDRIGLYLVNREKLLEDSQTARKLFEEKYNWELIEKKLIKIVVEIKKD